MPKKSNLIDRLNIKRKVLKSDENLDKLAEELINIKLSDPNTNMAYLVTDFDLKMIPEYDGNPEELIYFCQTVRDLLARACQSSKAHRETNQGRIFSMVQYRIKGLGKICFLRYTFQTVEEILEYLENQYKDSRTCDQLMDEIHTITPFRTEHPLLFLERIEGTFALLCARAKLDEVHYEQYIQFVERNIISHITKHLHPDVVDYIRFRNLNTLESIRKALQNDAAYIVDRTYKTQNSRDSYTPKRHYSIQPQYRFQPKMYPSQYTNSHLPKTPEQKFRPPLWHQDHPQHNHQRYTQPQHPQPQHPQPRPTQPIYNQQWDTQRQHEYFNKPVKHDNSNTVSMRTVRSSQLNHLEDTAFRELSARCNTLETTVKTLTDKLDHFLDLGQHRDKPPPSTH